MCDFSRFGGASGEWLAIQAELPQAATGQSLETLKAVTNAGREKVSEDDMKGLRDHVAFADFTITARDGYQIESRCYKPKDQAPGSALCIHLHGGGFLFGTLSSEDAICSRLAIAAGVQVLNVNYRHTPEHRYPTAWNDAEDAVEWAFEHYQEIDFDRSRVILCGISAGAWISASLVLAQNLGARLTGVPRFAGQVLMIPSLVHSDCYEKQLAKMASPGVSSKEENKNAPILSKERADMFTGLLRVQNPEPNDVFLSPGNASVDQIRGLPPTVLGIAGLDPLRDEGILFGELCAEASVPTRVHVFKGVPHGFRRYGDKLSLSKRWDEVISGGVSWILSAPQSCEALQQEG